MIKLRAIAECVIDLEKGHVDGSSEIHFGILAHLIVERGKPVARGTLVDAFWWNADETDGRHCLRQAIYKLRQMGVPIEGDGDSFMLGERAALADFDCADERTLALSPLPPEQAVAIFPGYAPRASAPFLTWLERTREKAGRAVRGVLVRALGEARRRNGWEEAAKLARQCLVLDPLNEEATLTLAEYTALQGDKREALRLIDSYMEEIGGTYGDLRIPASLLRNRISERVAYPPASAAGKIPIVGREDSLRVLAGVATEVNGGAGQTCVIHGPPGIGKTRLITEFANISAMKGARIVRVECHADAAERALSVFMELAPQLLRMPGALGCSPEALRLVRRLGRHDPNERLDPDEYGGPAFLHAAVRASLRDLIDAIAAERPLYLMIEDVHWIDPISLEVLKEIIGSNRGRALLVLMTTRTLGDGELLRGVDRRQLIVHELATLGEVASRRLAETLCGALAIQADARLIDWCMQRGAGNPLFMTELLAHWRETKDMERVPVSLEALIDERVGALSEGALRALQAIALLEGEATYEMLEAVLGMQRWQVMGCAEELDKAGLVWIAPDRLTARHQLLGCAAAGRLTVSLRCALHHRIAAEFERRPKSDGHNVSLLLAAEHFHKAGASAQAVALSIRSADHLAALGAQSQAADMLGRSLDFATTTEERLQILEARRRMLHAAMRYPDLIANSEFALALERTSIGVKRIHNSHEISLHSVWHQVEGGSQNRAVAMTQMLGCAHARDASVAHRLEACVWGIATAAADGLADRAHAFERALSRIEVDSAEQRFARCKSALIYHTVFGSLDEAARTSTQLTQVASRLPEPLRPSAYRIGAYCFRLAGNFSIARSLLRSAWRLADRFHVPMQAAFAAGICAMTFAEEGEYDRCWDYYQQAVSLAMQSSKYTPPAILLAGAEFAYLRGDLDTGDNLIRSLPALGPRRARFDKLCLEVFANCARGRQVDNAALDEAMASHTIFAAFGWQDFNTTAIASALALRDGADAVRFVADYLRVRRERWPVKNRLLLGFINTLD